MKISRSALIHFGAPWTHNHKFSKFLLTFHRTILGCGATSIPFRYVYNFNHFILFSTNIYEDKLRIYLLVMSSIVVIDGDVLARFFPKFWCAKFSAVFHFSTGTFFKSWSNFPDSVNQFLTSSDDEFMYRLIRLIWFRGFLKVINDVRYLVSEALFRSKLILRLVFISLYFSSCVRKVYSKQ